MHDTDLKMAFRTDAKIFPSCGDGRAATLSYRPKSGARSDRP